MTEHVLTPEEAERDVLRAEVERLRAAISAHIAAQTASVTYINELTAENDERKAIISRQNRTILAQYAVVEAARVLWKAGADSFYPHEWTALAQALAALDGEAAP